MPARVVERVAVANNQGVRICLGGGRRRNGKAFDTVDVEEHFVGTVVEGHRDVIPGARREVDAGRAPFVRATQR